MRKIKKIIIHCSDSDFGDVELIDSWHRERGFDEIGYHYLILNGSKKKNVFSKALDGLLQLGRSIKKAGAHCKGENSDSIGICLIGKRLFSQRQLMVALPELLIDLLKEYNLTAEDIYPHNYFNNNKKCPNIDIELIRATVKGG